MSYKTHNFEDGKALLAEQLNEMDAAIAALYTADNLPNAPVGGGAYRVTLTVVEHIEGEDDFYVCVPDKSMREITAALESGMCVTAVYPFQLEDSIILPIDVPYKTTVDEDGVLLMLFSGSLSLEQESLFISALVMDADGTTFAQVYVTEAGETGEAPNIATLSINGVHYNGKSNVDMTDTINRMIDAKLDMIPNAEEASF